MNRNLTFKSFLAIFCTIMAAVACKDPNQVEPVNPDDPDTPTVTPPVALISIDEQTRTSVKFTIAAV